ncbi:MAG: FadR/GntR family transcriptional regulator [Chloroflexi bacterium]|nr:FadR/GntR family transcriptional regulator [Chloroflexota bacterium]MCY3581388.1 FadR/GntR family transcriptional regulator [Chloroflexota bacterium]MCY3717533.1 FadR/GntR family transcriptional regulator [Chloroflexota bacterium]MDE2651958.1 FadR/GntR family transcriptional regulator [Chloroflexota bacterium]MXV91993.1 FadR family transcriptional regulator [Chloroflexota bacterium]
MADSSITLKHPRRITLVASIVEQLVEHIQNGSLQAGDKLPSERQLMKMLGVGRSSVREALQGLVMMGLVEMRPGHGSYVKTNLHSFIPDLSKPHLSDNLQREMRLQLIEARRMIEVEIAGQAASRASQAQLKNWRATFGDYVRYIDDFSDPRYLAAHADFHLSLADMTQNPFNVMLVKAAIQSVPQTLREREFSFPKSIDLQQLRENQVKLHRDIQRAVVNQDVAEARATMQAHMDFERNLVIKVYPATGDDG